MINFGKIFRTSHFGNEEDANVTILKFWLSIILYFLFYTFSRDPCRSRGQH